MGRGNRKADGMCGGFGAGPLGGILAVRGVAKTRGVGRGGECTVFGYIGCGSRESDGHKRTQDGRQDGHRHAEPARYSDELSMHSIQCRS